MAEFYGARQREDESVSAWSCRLESILSKAIERGIVNRWDADGMLHSMLWTGLKTSFKDISGHKYDTISDFDGLRVALRQIENDHNQRDLLTPTAKPQTSKSVDNKAEPNSEITELKGMVQQLVARMDSYETSRQTPSWQQHQQPRWIQPQTWNQPPWQQQWHQPSNQPQKGQGIGRGQQGSTSRQQRIKCWRCGLLGYRKANCKVRLDHSKRDLNRQMPMKGERSQAR